MSRQQYILNNFSFDFFPVTAVDFTKSFGNLNFLAYLITIFLCAYDLTQVFTGAHQLLPPHYHKAAHREKQTIHTRLCPYGQFHIIQFSVQLKRAIERVRERETNHNNSYLQMLYILRYRSQNNRDKIQQSNEPL